MLVTGPALVGEAGDQHTSEWNPRETGTERDRS